MSETIHGNFIAGRWVEGIDVNENGNPSDLDETVGLYARASADQTREAIAAARSAFPAWSRTPLEQRQAVLQRIGDELIARKDELGRLLAREEGKTLAEGVGEIARSGQFFQYYAAEVLRQIGDLAESVRPGIDIEVRREPLGVIGIITPWNFPTAIPAWKVAPALAYGNCVVLKPADLVPASAWAMAEIISRSGLPEGAFNLVMGRGREVGETILNAPEVAAITFTGSEETGGRVAQAAVARMAKVQLEMGGKNPLIVLDDADLENAVACAALGAFGGTGQKCTASSRLIVTKGIHDRFVEALCARMAAFKVDHALAEGAQIGPVVDRRQFDSNQAYLETGKGEGAKLAVGGEPLQRERRGHYMAPALFVDTHNDMRINREEIFGPIAAVIRVKDYDEALATANDTKFGLTAGICTNSLALASDFKRNAEAGRSWSTCRPRGPIIMCPSAGVRPRATAPANRALTPRSSTPS